MLIRIFFPTKSFRYKSFHSIDFSHQFKKNTENFDIKPFVFFLLLVRDIEFLKSETAVKRKMLLQRIDFMMRRNDHCRHLAGLCTCS